MMIGQSEANCNYRGCVPIDFSFLVDTPKIAQRYLTYAARETPKATLRTLDCAKPLRV